MKHLHQHITNWLCCTAALLTCGFSIRTIVTATDAATNTVDFALAQTTWEQNGDLLVSYMTDENGETLTPSAVQKSTTTSGLRGAASLPESYSLTDVDGVSYLTSVKDQGSTGLCWAYACIGACESNILWQGLNIEDDWLNDNGELDLSEASLAWYIYTERMQLGDLASGDYITLNGKGISGGNSEIAGFAMAAGIGAQLEQYISIDDWDTGYSEYQRYTAYYEMESFDTIWTLASGSEDIIKEWILESGGVCVSYYSDGTYYDNGSSTAYYQTTYTEDDANHGVLIVGWDDSYSRNNFEKGTRPNSDGAWLVRNSWGTDSNDDGYFWISYEEASLCDWTRYQMTEPNDQEIRYQYDGGVSYSGLAVNAAANIFTAQEDGTLTDVMFPLSSLNDTNVQYTITLYLLDEDGQSPTDGTPVSTASGTIEYSGYKTIALDTPVTVQKGDRFSVVLSLRYTTATTSSVPYIAFESNLESAVTANCLVREGQSFVQKNDGSWVDMIDLQEYTNSAGEYAYANLGNLALKVIAVGDQEETNTTQLEAALSYGAPTSSASTLYQRAYTAATSLRTDAAQWEIDNAAENLLAALEQEGLLSFPQNLYVNYTYTLGDVDKDGTITINDAYTTLLAYARENVGILDVLLPGQVAAADINADGNLTLTDAYDILLYYAYENVGIQMSWEEILQKSTAYNST